MLAQRFLRPARSAFTAARSSPRSSTRLARPSVALAQQARHLHEVPSFGAYDERFATDGVLGLYAPDGYRIGWLDYQSHLIQKLNELTAGEKLADESLQNIIVQYGRDPANASLFNHASMAFNNHFFFQTFSTAPQQIDRFPDMKEDLEQAFGSIDNLKHSMIESAAGMFGPGFTWLAWNAGPSGSVTTPALRSRGNNRVSHGNNSSSEGGGEWVILNTYAAGTPLGTRGNRRQPHDMNERPLGAMGPFSAAGINDAAVPPGGTRLCPVLCVSTWEHSYLYDFGVRGKRQYLLQWWDTIDWLTVNLRCGENYGPNRLQHSGGSARRGGGNQFAATAGTFQYR